MARLIGPKNKLSRREGFDLFSRGNNLKRLDVPPGQHGHKRQRHQTDYGRQLREKQKVKRYYGLLERQFRNLVQQALHQPGDPKQNLLIALERRLDNVLFRAGFFPTRPSARQTVVHGHIEVNDLKLTIPSYPVQVGDIISLTPTAASMPVVQQMFEAKVKPPPWLDKQGTAVKVKFLPDPSLILEPLDPTLILEFYSR